MCHLCDKHTYVSGVRITMNYLNLYFYHTVLNNSFIYVIVLNDESRDAFWLCYRCERWITGGFLFMLPFCTMNIMIFKASFVCFVFCEKNQSLFSWFRLLSAKVYKVWLKHIVYVESSVNNILTFIFMKLKLIISDKIDSGKLQHIL